MADQPDLRWVAGIELFARGRAGHLGALVASLIGAGVGIYDMNNMNRIVHDVAIAKIGGGLWLRSPGV
jgi:hypothetical protein